jgi:hypothetical protein
VDSDGFDSPDANAAPLNPCIFLSLGSSVAVRLLKQDPRIDLIDLVDISTWIDEWSLANTLHSLKLSTLSSDETKLSQLLTNCPNLSHLSIALNPTNAEGVFRVIRASNITELVCHGGPEDVSELMPIAVRI